LIGQQYFASWTINKTYKILKKQDNDKKNFKWLLLVSLTACNSDDAVVVVSNSSDGLPLTAGVANFSKYVALGNSLTSGYSDLCLLKVKSILHEYNGGTI
jgi:hypothetical protein